MERASRTGPTTSAGQVEPIPSPFTIDNIPYGVISTTGDRQRRCASAFQSDAIELKLLEEDGFFNAIPGFERPIFALEFLNDFARLHRNSQIEVRNRIIKFLSIEPSIKQQNRYFVPLDAVKNHLPMQTFNFSDFYCSIEHARNCTEVMGGTCVNSNWFIAPMVYNGRTSSLTVSGTPVCRPRGIIQPTIDSQAVFCASGELDFELEVGIVVSQPLPPGEILDIADAKDHIFGLVILNDWSSRDIQMFEMPPLGPFHGKGFATSISPWIVTMAALQSVESPRAIEHVSAPLPHLRWTGHKSQATFNIELSVSVLRNGVVTLLGTSNLNELYWTPYEQITHLSSAGEGLCTGDIIGTGTVSSDRVNEMGEKSGLGCLFERTLRKNQLASQQEIGLKYLQDGDEVIMDGWCTLGETGRRFGFGQCRGFILPATVIN